MIEALLDLLSWVALALGGFFFLVGGVGLVRMPDLFTRMHAASVSETLGTGLLILGMALQAGLTLVTVKLLIIFFTLMVVAPVSSHALARAALHDGKFPLLANAKGWLVEMNPLELFPELRVRLHEPLVSEQVEQDEPPENGPEGDLRAIEGPADQPADGGERR